MNYYSLRLPIFYDLYAFCQTLRPFLEEGMEDYLKSRARSPRAPLGMEDMKRKATDILRLLVLIAVLVIGWFIIFIGTTQLAEKAERTHPF